MKEIFSYTTKTLLEALGQHEDSYLELLKLFYTDILRWPPYALCMAAILKFFKQYLINHIICQTKLRSELL